MMAKSVSLRNIVLERNEVMFLLNSRFFAFDFILCSTDFSLYLSIASTSLTSAE